MRKPLAVLVLALLITAVTASTAMARAKLTVTLNNNAQGENFFSPTKKTIRPKTLVTWVWKGTSQHDVTLYSAPKAIKTDDYGRYSSILQSSGGKFRKTLKSTGTYKFACTIHPDMKLRITVKKKQSS